jgi:large subunit ribosomal protein L24
MNIKKGDTVKIISGKDRGKSGKVIHVYPKIEKIAVEGINVYKKHVRPRRQGEKGEIVSVTRPFSFSNVMMVCPSCGKPIRVGSKKEGDTKKVRYCRKCHVTF